MSAPTLWQEGHWTGDRVIRLSISVSILAVVADIAVTGRLDWIFDVVFVSVCIGAALAVRPGDFFDIGVLPPLLLLGCCMATSLVARGAVATAGDGLVQGVISGLAEHSGSLAAGYILLLMLLALRQRVISTSTDRHHAKRHHSKRHHSNRLGSPAP